MSLRSDQHLTPSNERTYTNHIATTPLESILVAEYKISDTLENLNRDRIKMDTDALRKFIETLDAMKEKEDEAKEMIPETLNATIVCYCNKTLVMPFIYQDRLLYSAIKTVSNVNSFIKSWKSWYFKIHLQNHIKNTDRIGNSKKNE